MGGAGARVYSDLLYRADVCPVSSLLSPAQGMCNEVFPSPALIG